MFLKQLDIYGFKSFAEKISIDFVPGITAVVGPNGSGKSNITDALRWVLGEQSAKSLRGETMEDVIFAGSDSRRALNFAEVEITLDNTAGILPLDFTEISVKRRVSRTGDSEFYLNNQPCRLRDIHDLFIDSGLGREAFSIIGQGSVDQILNSKPEERRTIFEEAAGVLKYKQRKRKAESKLAETEDHLLRVNDILHELEHQIEPLREQAALAKEYLQKQDSLKTYDIGLIVHEIDRLHSKWEKAKSRYEGLNDEEIQISSRIHLLESAIEKGRQEKLAIENTVAALQENLLSLSENIEKIEGKKQVFVERQKNSAFYEKQISEQILTESEKLTKLDIDIDQLKKELIEKEIAAEELAKTLSKKRERHQAFDRAAEATIDSKKSDYIELLNEHASSKNELAYIKEQKRQNEVRARRLSDEETRLKSEKQKLERTWLDLASELKIINKSISELSSNVNIIDAQLEKAHKDWETKRSVLFQLERKLTATKTKKESLEGMTENYSGFFQGVREVLKAKDKHLRGIKGAVVQLFDVKKEYTKAIETALGPSAQHLVVETEREAREAIEYLKRNQLGQATFLPINVIKGKKMPELQINQHFVGIADQLITYDEKYKQVMSYLLGDVIIAQDLKEATSLARLLNYRYRIVTLDGEVINRGGSMTGGKIKQQRSTIMSRKAELEQIRIEYNKLLKQRNDVERFVQEMSQSLAEMEEQAEAFQQKQKEKVLKMHDLKAELNQIEIQKRNHSDRLEVCFIEKSELAAERQKLEEKAIELTSYLQKKSSDINTLKQEIGQLTAKREEDLILKQRLAEEINELTARSAVANEQLSAAQGELDRLQQNEQEFKNRLKKLNDEIENLKQEQIQHENLLHEAEKQSFEQQREKEELLQDISDKRKKSFELHQQLLSTEADLKQLKKKHKKITKDAADEEMNIHRLDVELESYFTKLREEYTLSYERAKDQYTLKIDVEEARTRMETIRQEILLLGTVNTGAIDEFERINKRYNFLLEQQLDLVEAKDTLYHIIDEMDREMIKRFRESFQLIQIAFKEVFSTLFGGGKAELTLTEPDKLLTTGIDIVAQPPGKKLQNLSLLSGGERSLTAISLLFSILKVRPVPFCVFDEVEAALDEANVQRFITYLRKFSKDTQFIIITHRQGTMAGSDVLYGVTMQESGVSKLVSVKLQQDSVFA